MLDANNLRPTERIVLLVLLLARKDGITLTRAELLKRSGAGKNTFDRAWKNLLDAGYVQEAASLTTSGHDLATHTANLSGSKK